ncbi:OsmC family protein [Thermatribacter velox]|uniref:OsmC family protein n=1 Tax=Thermatribacter velox TaxID=3039681 RepID=A0ABZ2YFL3_9BACT
MLRRTSRAIWMGNLKEGKGTVELGSGAFKGSYSFRSRFENGSGTNPEELIAAAHAGCFAMALSHLLSESGYTPEKVEAQATISMEAVEGGFKIKSSHLECTTRVPGISEEEFLNIAQKAKATCPVSVLLSSIDITLSARLEQN